MMRLSEITENKMMEKEPCWSGYEMIGMKDKNGNEVPNCVPEDVNEYIVPDEVCEVYGCHDSQIDEAEYQGKKVDLNKPFRTPGESKKFAVYVKNDKGNVIKVRFGDSDMEIKRDDPDHKSSYRARHHCDDPGPKTKANYWSCRSWSSNAPWV